MMPHRKETQHLSHAIGSSITCRTDTRGKPLYAVGRKTVERELGKSSSKKESKEDSQQ